MKKIIIAFVLIASSVSIKAQQNVVKVNPLGLLFGVANAGYERVIANNQTLSVNGNYFNLVNVVKGFGIGANYNLYLTDDHAPKGFYVGPGLGVSFLSDSEISANLLNINATGGYQWIISKHFAVDLSASGYYLTTTKFKVLNEFNFSFGIGLGYAW